MTTRLRILSALLVALVLALVALVGAGPALAARGVGHHQGVLWATDHASWIGSYRLDDGNVGYCIDVTRPQPLGADFDYVDGSTLGLFSAADSARLAFISRHWGTPSDPLTAAAAQLATWTVAGLGGHDQSHYAKRANDSAADVLTSANRILALADGPGGASTGVRAEVDLSVEGPGASARAELVAAYLAGEGTVPSGSFSGTMTVTGGSFDGGARSRPVLNGETVHIVPDERGATETVSVEVTFTRLPFGPGFRFGRNAGSSQNLLVDHPFTVDASARAQATGPTELPFRPRVSTVTSTAVATPGTALTDSLTLDVHPQSPTAPDWGVFTVADGLTAPIPVVIASTLHGPFPAPPVEGDTAPAGGAVVCTVETRVITGAGRYESPSCVVEAPGFYVWTDAIDPARTPPEQGGDRLQPWQSRFGEVAETTLLPATPTVVTAVSDSTLDRAGCVSDRLTITGLPAGIESFDVRSTLIGPLPALPEPETVPVGWRTFPVAGTVTTSVPGDGTHESPCISVTRPGHYYFVIDSDAAGPSLPVQSSPNRATSAADGPTLIPAISDVRVHVAEAVELLAPPPTSPSAPPTPHPPVSVSPSPPTPQAVAQLAQTGRATSDSAIPIAVAISTVILALAGAGAVATRRR